MKFSRLLQFALGLASLFLPGGLPLSGQFLKVGISGNIPIGKLETMNYDLQIADREQRTDVLRRLGIDTNIAEAATSPRFSNDISIQSLRTRSENSYGIVSVPCGLQGAAFIFLLDKTGTDTWRAVDYIALDWLPRDSDLQSDITLSRRRLRVCATRILRPWFGGSARKSGRL